jgi:hypothetical protein
MCNKKERKKKKREEKKNPFSYLLKSNKSDLNDLLFLQEVPDVKNLVNPQHDHEND